MASRPPRPQGQEPRKRGRGTNKTAVFALVEPDGRVRSTPNDNAIMVTDELASYPKAAAGFGGHERVKHRAQEYLFTASG